MDIFATNTKIVRANKTAYFVEIRARGYKTFSMLNSVEHEILKAHKYENIKKFNFFYSQVSVECYFSGSFMLKCQQLLAF